MFEKESVCVHVCVFVRLPCRPSRAGGRGEGTGRHEKKTPTASAAWRLPLSRLSSERGGEALLVGRWRAASLKKPPHPAPPPHCWERHPARRRRARRNPDGALMRGFRARGEKRRRGSPFCNRTERGEEEDVEKTHASTSADAIARLSARNSLPGAIRTASRREGGRGSLFERRRGEAF